MTAPWIVAFISLALVTALLAAVVLGLFKRFILALEAVERVHSGVSLPGVRTGLPPGSRVPSFAIELARRADPMSLTGTSGDDPWALAILSPDCDACHGLVKELEEGRWRSPKRLVVVWPRLADRIPTVQGNAVVALADESSIRAEMSSDIYPNVFIVSSEHIVLQQFVPSILADVHSALDDSTMAGHR